MAPEWKLGTLVLAKVKGFPAWPAKVANPEDHGGQQARKDKTFVTFFGTQEIRFCNREDIVRFSGEPREAAITKSKSKAAPILFRKGVELILEEEKLRGESVSNDESEDAEERADHGSPSTSTRRLSGSPGTRSRENKEPKSRKRQRVDGGTSATAVGLLDGVKQSSKAAQIAARQWIDRYQDAPRAAFAELLTFFFQTCGSAFIMEEESAMEKSDVDDVVQRLVASSQEAPLEDLISGKTKDTRAFKQNLLDFWGALVQEANETPSFQQELLVEVMDYIIGVSCTSPRIFRHVATAVGLRLVTSLVDSAKTLGETRETVQRQLNAEKKKKKDGPRIVSLNKALSEIHEKTVKIEEMMRKLFTGLFMHRYRDVEAEIRLACINSIGYWIKEYPALFLQDLYLKYLGWTLNDRDSRVRQASVSSLIDLYKNDDNLPALEMFTQRFGPRMVEIADDVNPDVAVKAIELLKELLRHEMLNEEALEPLYLLLVDESEQIRHAIGHLVHEHLIAQTLTQDSPSKRGKTVEDQTRRILMILDNHGSPELRTYVIDALWEHAKALQDWKVLVKMLLAERTKDALSATDTAHLVQVLKVSVRKAFGDHVLPGVEKPKAAAKTKKEKDALEALQSDFTSAMMKTYVQLLKKFAVEKENLASLLDIFQYLKLDQFSLKRQDANLLLVLEIVKDTFLKHGDDQVLESCSRVLQLCSQNGPGDLQEAVKQVVTNAVTTLQDKILTIVNGTDLQESEDEEYLLTTTLRQLHWLQFSAPVITHELYQALVNILEDWNNMSAETLELALRNLFIDAVWEVKGLESAADVGGRSTDVLNKRDTLIRVAQALLRSALDDSSEVMQDKKLQRTIASCLSDSWILFSQKSLSGTKLEHIGLEPSAEEVGKFWELCSSLLRHSEGDEDAQEDIMLMPAKLLTRNASTDDELAAEVISSFVRYGKGVGEVVKHVLGTLKQRTSMEKCWNLQLKGVIKAYERDRDAAVDEDGPSSQPTVFANCKGLANKLASTYVSSNKSASPHLVKLVHAAIDYACSDTSNNLRFLQAGVAPFAARLSAAEHQKMISYLQTRARASGWKRGDASWTPMEEFLEHLQEKSSKARGAAGPRHQFSDAETTAEHSDAIGDDDDTPRATGRSVRPESADEEPHGFANPSQNSGRSDMEGSRGGGDWETQATEERLPVHLASRRRMYSADDLGEGSGHDSIEEEVEEDTFSDFVTPSHQAGGNGKQTRLK